MTSSRSLHNLLFSTLVLLVLAVPLASPGTVAADTWQVPAEGSPLAKGLKLARNLAGFPPAYEKYFQEHFLLREDLVRLNYDMRLRLLGETVFANVLVGAQGWLYLSDEGNLDYYQHANPFNTKELTTLQNRLDRMQARLAASGTTFIVIAAPNKESIYPEFLPASVRQVRPDSQLDQILAYSKTGSGVKIIDLRPLLLAAKNGAQVYNRTDTHWNELGAYLVYRAVLDPLRYPAWRLHSLEDYTLQPEPLRGDLSRLLPLTQPLIETSTALNPRFTRQARVLEENASGVTITEVANPALPRAVIFRDSFFNSLMPFFSEHFSRAVYVRSYILDEDLIAAEKPDVVILEVAERYLKTLAAGGY